MITTRPTVYSEEPAAESFMHTYLNTLQLPQVIEEQLALLNALISETNIQDTIMSFP